MTNPNTLDVNGTKVTLRAVEHMAGVPAYADFLVDDEHENEIGRVWEYSGKWRAKTSVDGRFVEVAKLLDALEVVVRLTQKTAAFATTQYTPNEDLLADWQADGRWHKPEQPALITGFLLALVHAACPNGTLDPFNEGVVNRDDTFGYSWEGPHTPFDLLVRRVPVWQSYDGSIGADHAGNPVVVANGNPLRMVARHSPDAARRPMPPRWEEMVGYSHYVVGYRIEPC